MSSLTMLTIKLPQALLPVIPGAAEPLEFLMLEAQGLTEDQLIAVAESGLPASY